MAWLPQSTPASPTAGGRSGGCSRRERRSCSARGTCRDFAVLFIEAARFLGFAARFVTGYLYDPGADGCEGRPLSGGGSTHAWADVFIPGVGWIEFDPTNRIVAGRNLLRVAVTRTQTQALPVSGVFSGDGAFRGMAVDVSVRRAD